MRYLLLSLCIVACARLTEGDLPRPAASLAPVSLPNKAPSPRWAWENPLPQGNPLSEFWGDGRGLLLAVGQRGSIVRTRDEQTWHALASPTEAALLSISGAKTSIFIAGLGGVWRTNDAGDSWRKLSLNEGVSQVRAFDSGLVYALDSGSILHVSRDLGDTWSDHTISASAYLSHLWANDSGVLLAAEASDFVYQSVPYAAYGAPVSPLKAGDLWRSEDFGETWARVSFASYPDRPVSFWRAASGVLFGVGYSYLFVRSEMSCGSCVNVGQSTLGVFTSDDLGKTWTRTELATSTSFGGLGMRSPASPVLMGAEVPHKLWVQEPYGPLRQSDDLGKTWEVISDTKTNVWRQDPQALWANTRGQLYYTGAQGALSRSDTSWTSISTSLAEGGEIIDALELSDGSVLAVGYKGLILRRDTKGHWRKLEIPTSNDLLHIARDGGVILLSGTGVTLRSVDNGESFQVLPTEGPGVISAIEQTWWLSGRRGVLSRSTDHGDTWETPLKATNDNEYSAKIAQLPDGSYVLSGSRYLDSAKLLGKTAPMHFGWVAWLKTSKDGLTWTEVTGLPLVHSATLLVQRDGTLWLGGEDGALYQSKKTEGPWTKLSPSVKQSIKQLAETSDGRVWAIGEQAVLVSTDQGATWKTETPPLQASLLRELSGGGLLWFGRGALIVYQEKP